MKNFLKKYKFDIFPLVVSYLIFFIRLIFTIDTDNPDFFLTVWDFFFFIVYTIVTIVLIAYILIFSKINVVVRFFFIGVCWIITICSLFMTLFFKIIG